MMAARRPKPPFPPDLRRIARFAIHTYPGSAHLVAQAEDGSLWLLNWQEKAWRRVPDLPAVGEEGAPV